jgi:hypothetical protein
MSDHSVVSELDDDGEEKLTDIKINFNQDVLITGPSGLGKSRLGAMLATKFNYPLIRLDQFGSTIGDKWIINQTSLKHALLAKPNAIVEGQGDNLEAIASILCPDLVIFPVPPINRFSDIQYLKSNKVGLLDAWRKGYIELAESSVGDYTNWLYRKLCHFSHFLLKVNPNLTILVVLTSGTKPIQVSDHGDQNDADLLETAKANAAFFKKKGGSL